MGSIPSALRVEAGKPVSGVLVMMMMTIMKVIVFDMMTGVYMLITFKGEILEISNCLSEEFSLVENRINVYEEVRDWEEQVW